MAQRRWRRKDWSGWDWGPGQVGPLLVAGGSAGKSVVEGALAGAAETVEGERGCEPEGRATGRGFVGSEVGRGRAGAAAQGRTG